MCRAIPCACGRSKNQRGAHGDGEQARQKRDVAAVVRRLS
jgi:hypothetical protein